MTRASLRHSRKSGNPLRLTFLLTVTLLVPPGAFAQVTTGLPPFGSFSGGSFDTVNNANLNVHLAIPIVNKAGRGMPFTYTLTYDSSIWSPVNSTGSAVWTPVGQTATMPTNWGWRGITEGQAGYISYRGVSVRCGYGVGQYTYYTLYGYWTYHDAWGTPHMFNIATTPGSALCGVSPVSSGTAAATDGSGYTMSVTNYTSAVVHSRSGDLIQVPKNTSTGAASVTDPNGNQISASVASNTTTFTDTLGTTPLTVIAPGGGSNTTYTYTGPNGSAAYTVKYTSYTVRTNFGCPSVTEYGATPQYLVSEIDLPDYDPITNPNEKYAFDYEVTPGYPTYKTGRLASVTLPTGGQITYSYTGGSSGHITCADGTAATLKRYTPDTGSNYWQYAHSEAGSAWTTTVTDPAGNQTTYNFQGLYETQRSNSLETVTTCYNGTTSNCNTTSITLPIKQRTATVSVAGLKSKTDAFYDYNSTTGVSYGLPTKVDQYAYGSGVVGGFLRETMTCYASLTNQYIKDRPSAIAVYSATGDHGDCTGTSGLQAKSSYLYDTNTGNLTSETRSTGGTPSTISRSFTYGSYGVLTGATDFNTNQTTYTNTACNSAFPTTITTPPPFSFTSSMAWDTNCNGAVVTSVTDENSQPTTYSYDTAHNFWRLAGTSFPDGGSVTTTYASPTEIGASTKVTSSLTRQDQIDLDGLGRVATTSLVNDPDGQTYVDTHYDSSGRVHTASNPYRVSSGGGETYAYDALNRVASVKHADDNTAYAYYGTAVSGAGGRSAQLCAAGTYGYGYPSLMKDESGKLRQFWTDALGRTIEVDEPDPATGSLTTGSVNNTCYKYDVLGNLYQVVQGSETRNYTHDWLSRLTGAQTPESKNLWAYFYYTTSGGALCSGDPSAVCRKTDARSITATYTYDALNRLTGISYSNGDPAAIGYTYDQTACLGLSVSCYNIGRRTTMTDVSGTTQWAYDAMGRVLREHRTINSVTKDITYTYNLDGSLATLTYPSGRLVTYAPSAVGRPVSATDTTHSVTYVNSAHYAPQGALSSAQFGAAPINYSVSFDSRLRPSQIYAHASADLFKLDLSYFANSSVQTITNDLTPGRTLNLTYDNLNRLATAQTVATSGQYCWGQAVPPWSGDPSSQGYDRYANLLIIDSMQCSAPTLNLSVNTSGYYNQVTNSGFTYDNAGNMTADGLTSYVWNGAGLLKTVGTTTYTYDGDGKRVMNSAGTYYWTTPSGGQLSDTPGAGAGNEYIFFAGQRIAWVDSGGTVRYYWGDHLGTSRIVTDAAGNVCYDADYYPFQGERTPYVNTCTPAYKFAGMKFDPESGNYYTLNRYYPPNLGRWLSPDPLGGDVTNPQSLNRYAYVMNNPCTLVDPLGLGDCSLNITILDYGLLSAQQISSAEMRIRSLFAQANVNVFFNQSDPDFTVPVSFHGQPSDEFARTEAYSSQPTFFYADAIFYELNGQGVDPRIFGYALGSGITHEATHFLFGSRFRGESYSRDDVTSEGWDRGKLLNQNLSFPNPGAVNRKCKQLRRSGGRRGGGGGRAGPPYVNIPADIGGGWGPFSFLGGAGDPGGGGPIDNNGDVGPPPGWCPASAGCIPPPLGPRP